MKAKSNMTSSAMATPPNPAYRMFRCIAVELLDRTERHLSTIIERLQSTNTKGSPSNSSVDVKGWLPGAQPRKIVLFILPKKCA